LTNAKKYCTLRRSGNCRRDDQFIDSVRKDGDTVGGKVSCHIKNCPVGLGEPVFDKLHADLGKAMLSINAVHGFEFGSGFAGSEMRGSEHNDIFIKSHLGDIKTITNFSGGIQGGISNGMPIEFKVAFKPVATIMQNQATVDSEGNAAEISGKGRHDPCVVPRAVPIVEAMAALVLADHWLRNRNHACLYYPIIQKTRTQVFLKIAGTCAL
jgi:chorismate synthase